MASKGIRFLATCLALGGLTSGDKSSAVAHRTHRVSRVVSLDQTSSIPVARAGCDAAAAAVTAGSGSSSDGGGGPDSKQAEPAPLDDLVPITLNAGSMGESPPLGSDPRMAESPRGRQRVRRLVGHSDEGDSEDEFDFSDDDDGSGSGADGSLNAAGSQGGGEPAAGNARALAEEEDVEMAALKKAWGSWLSVQGSQSEAALRKHPFYQAVAPEFAWFGGSPPPTSSGGSGGGGDQGKESGGRRSAAGPVWIPRRQLVEMRGAAAAALHPAAFERLKNGGRRRASLSSLGWGDEDGDEDDEDGYDEDEGPAFPRGFRLLAPLPGQNGGGETGGGGGGADTGGGGGGGGVAQGAASRQPAAMTHAMQECIGLAVAHAFGAHFVAVDEAVLRWVASASGREAAPVSRERVLAALFQRLRDDDAAAAAAAADTAASSACPPPSVVLFLRNKGDAVLRSRGAVSAVLAERARPGGSRLCVVVAGARDRKAELDSALAIAQAQDYQEEEEEGDDAEEGGGGKEGNEEGNAAAVAVEEESHSGGGGGGFGEEMGELAARAWEERAAGMGSSSARGDGGDGGGGGLAPLLPPDLPEDVARVFRDLGRALDRAAEETTAGETEEAGERGEEEEGGSEAAAAAQKAARLRAKGVQLLHQAFRDPEVARELTSKLAAALEQSGGLGPLRGLSVSVVLQAHTKDDAPPSQTPRGGDEGGHADGDGEEDEEEGDEDGGGGDDGLAALPAWLDAFLQRATSQRQESAAAAARGGDAPLPDGYGAAPAPRNAFAAKFSDLDRRRRRRAETNRSSQAERAERASGASGLSLPGAESVGREPCPFPAHAAAPPAPTKGGLRSSSPSSPGSTAHARGQRHALEASLQPVALPPPREDGPRRRWEGWVAAEQTAYTARRNALGLWRTLKATGLVFDPSEASEASEALEAAPPADAGGGGVGGGVQEVASLLGCFGDALGAALLTPKTLRQVALEALKAQVAASHGRVRFVQQSQPKRRAFASHGEAEGVLCVVVGRGAVEAALTVCAPQLPSKLPGLPPSRTKEQVAALASDKHERALVANVLGPDDIGVAYGSIGGLDHVKEVLRQCVTYPLKYPHLYREGLAADAVKGVLLFGPPGTGKTMLAKAVATEGGASFLSIDASAIENKWLGESEKNARAMFTLARKIAPCVIYIDEVDSLLSSRENGDDSSHGTLTSVKTTIMQEWDGLRTTMDRVVVIGSTNRPFDLDEAVLRRMPRRILVDLPDMATREEILKVSLSKNRVSPDVNLTAVAAKLEGYTGSDIKEVCREAVVTISHAAAVALENGNPPPSSPAAKGKAGADSVLEQADDDEADGDSFLDVVEVADRHRLRPVTRSDLERALSKLSASVNERGREAAKVTAWNEQYGEIKAKKKKRDAAFDLYL